MEVLGIMQIFLFAFRIINIRMVVAETSFPTHNKLILSRSLNNLIISFYPDYGMEPCFYQYIS